MSKLSIGGMGTVYKAEHTLIGKHAAVKILHPELSSNREIVQRFFNEAKATTTIKHPGIVEVFDYGVMSSGAAYLTMEFLEGMSLARRMKMKGPTSAGEAAMLLRGVCSALAAAHAKGIIHRDLKPDNIFMTPDPDSAIGERPKLLDFGIAKLTDIGLAGTATKTGAVMGTPTYMSPEQCRGTGDVDERADLYSIGCIFYELVTGEPPFTNLGAGELIGAHLYVEPDPPTKLCPDLDPLTVNLIMALLRKKPAERPQTAKELGQRLSDLAQKLGWITASSPSGVTAPALAALAIRAEEAATRSARPAVGGSAMSAAMSAQISIDKTTPLYTPGGSVAPSLLGLERSLDDLATEKPTTLSGAASQVDLQRRSRRGIGIAMAIAALLAGGGVAFYKLQYGHTKEVAAATAPAPAPVVTPAPAASPPPVVDNEPAKTEKPEDRIDAKPDENPDEKPDALDAKLEPQKVVVEKKKDRRRKKVPPRVETRTETRPVEVKKPDPVQPALPIERDIE